MIEQLDINDIVTRIPHRYPFLLVDRIISLDNDAKTITGIKNVTINEPFFQGHFPGQPIMPGVLILEAMAQVSGVMATELTPLYKKGDPLYFVGLDKVRFRRPVVPGDQLVIKIETIRGPARVWKFKGQALVEDEIAAEAELVAAINKN